MTTEILTNDSLLTCKYMHDNIHFNHILRKSYKGLFVFISCAIQLSSMLQCCWLRNRKACKKLSGGGADVVVGLG